MFGRRRTPPAATTARADDSPSAQGNFFEKALAAGGEWTRFADPKLLGTLALLGLGLANIISRAQPLWDAHTEHTVWGWAATGSFVGAGVFATLTVVCASLGLFPRVKPREGATASLYYFGGIASFDTPAAYEAAARAKTDEELESEVARQAWEVAQVAKKKHFWAKWAYRAVTVFLVSWVLARVALSFVS